MSLSSSCATAPCAGARQASSTILSMSSSTFTSRWTARRCVLYPSTRCLVEDGELREGETVYWPRYRKERASGHQRVTATVWSRACLRNDGAYSAPHGHRPFPGRTHFPAEARQDSGCRYPARASRLAGKAGPDRGCPRRNQAHFRWRGAIEGYAESRRAIDRRHRERLTA